MKQMKIPDKFNDFLKRKNWKLFKYQIEFLGYSQLDLKRFIISSDTGTGKTFTMFLPIIINALKNKKEMFIYVSPLKSIINDLYENLSFIIKDLSIDIKIGKRTGDESYLLKKKQIKEPTNILLTTPESLALMISNKEINNFFKNISYLAIDELNEMINTKRGDQLSLIISHIISLNKSIKIIAASTTIDNYSYLSNWISFNKVVKIIKNNHSKRIKLNILNSPNIPNYGHSVNFALDDIYKIIKGKKTIIFVNTRAQSEILFNNFFMKFPEFKIGVYHGSLSKKVRLDTEKKIKVGKISSLVSTSSLEMGIDWKDIDKVINIGAPKSVNKIVQRSGRSNHNFYSTSEALLVPTNKFEYLECLALKRLVALKKFDKLNEKKGSKDVLCQHLLLLSCNSQLDPEKTYHDIKTSYSYSHLTKSEFYKMISFVHNGGYALQNYNEIKKLKKLSNGNFIIKDEINRRNVLMNAGTIINSSSIKIKSTKGNLLGTVEDSFINLIKVNDSFNFAGMSLICVKVLSEEIIVKMKKGRANKVPVYWGGSIPLKSNLSQEILNILEEDNLKEVPLQIKSFIDKQKKTSGIPTKKEILIEKFPHYNGEYIFFHTFLGRETNQTLSNLLIQFLRKKQIFVINYLLNDYSFGVYFNLKTNLKKNDLTNFFKFDLNTLKSLDTTVAKRIFKEIAIISGLVKQNDIYTKKTNNFINCDIIFETLKKYEPNHIILKITEEEIEKHFLHSSQIYKFKNLKFNFNELTKYSEFSHSLLMEKEKIKATEPL